jgi:hypothetical protein
MSRDSLIETSLSGLRPVGIGSRRTLDAWDQLVAFVEADPQLGTVHAQLFAEPVTEQSDSVEWYRPAGLEGEAIACSDLPEDEQEKLKARARQLTQEVQARADELRRSDREELRRMGDTLATSLLLPSGREILYSVGGQPVFVNWGTVDDVADPPLAVLEDYLRPAAKAPEPYRPTAGGALAAGSTTLFGNLIIRRPWTWWNLLWLLVLLLLLAIFFLLLLGCGLGMPVGQTFLSYCPDSGRAMADDPLAQERQRTNELDSELDRLMDALRGLPRCPRPPVEEHEPPVTEEEDEIPDGGADGDTEDTEEADDFDERVEEAGGTVGDITVTLIWDGYPDLDLIVRCPDGSIISYERPSSCGGRLDIDANGADDRRDRPVENVYWPQGAAAPGEYQVYVDNFDGREAGMAPVPFSVRIQVGEEATVYEGAAAPPGGGDYVATFTIE